MSKYTDAKVIGVAYQADNLSIWKERFGKKVGAFCGIGNPDSFFEFLKGIGLEVISKKIFADHAPLNEATLRRFGKEVKDQGADALICTEKDLTKNR